MTASISYLLSYWSSPPFTLPTPLQNDTLFQISFWFILLSNCPFISLLIRHIHLLVPLNLHTYISQPIPPLWVHIPNLKEPSTTPASPTPIFAQHQWPPILLYLCLRISGYSSLYSLFFHPIHQISLFYQVLIMLISILSWPLAPLVLAIHITLINQFSFHSHLYLHLELEIHPLYLPSSTHPSIVYTNLLTLSRDLPPCLKPSIPGNSVAFYNPQGPHTVTPILTPFLLGINN